MRNTKGILYFKVTTWINPPEFIPMYLKFPVIPTLICHLYIYFYFILFFCCFFDYYFSLGVEYYSFFSCAIHLQYNVITIGVFTLYFVVQEVELVFYQTDPSYFQYTYWSVLDNCYQIMLANNKGNQKLHLVKIILLGSTQLDQRYLDQP